jgi:DNA-binding transcriptional MerR regulator
VTTRALRYYDEIGLLKPYKLSESGYRIYSQKEVDLLFQILVYRGLEVGLEEIKKIVTNPGFNEINALKEHKIKLKQRQGQINELLNSVEKVLNNMERGIDMGNDAKFEVFKQKMVDDNQNKYGEEIINKYGEETVKQSNKKLLGLSEDEYNEMNELQEAILDKLKEAYKMGGPCSELAQEACALHKKWLRYTWANYSKEAHIGLADMYVEDERFRAYYDKEQEGLAEFLRDAIVIFCS